MIFFFVNKKGLEIVICYGNLPHVKLQVILRHCAD